MFLYGPAAGVFHFRFWRYQHWYDIVIDDRLPYLPTQKRLWGARNSFEVNEFWVSLLEKAYAKLNGTYSSLGGGLPVNALTDFTGGIEQRFEFKSDLSSTHLQPTDLFDFIKSCMDFGSLIACSINADKRKAETILPNGLVVGHTYSITNYYILPLVYDHSLTQVSERGLLRFRNPWGNDVEWNGQWSDADPIWNVLDEKTRTRLSIRRKHDGEFWMLFKDFYREFDVMEVCHISPDTYDGQSLLPHSFSRDRDRRATRSRSRVRIERSKYSASLAYVVRAWLMAFGREQWRFMCHCWLPTWLLLLAQSAVRRGIDIESLAACRSVVHDDHCLDAEAHRRQAESDFNGAVHSDSSVSHQAQRESVREESLRAARGRTHR